MKLLCTSVPNAGQTILDTGQAWASTRAPFCCLILLDLALNCNYWSRWWREEGFIWWTPSPSIIATWNVTCHDSASQTALAVAHLQMTNCFTWKYPETCTHNNVHNSLYGFLVLSLCIRVPREVNPWGTTQNP